MSPSVHPAGSAVTVNEELCAVEPLTVTAKVPVVAPVGTMAVIPEAVQFVTEAGVPFKETVLVPCEEPNPVPVIITTTPAGPELGEMLEIVGDWACA